MNDQSFFESFITNNIYSKSNNNKKINHISYLLNSDRVINDTKNIADSFNHYYINVAKNLPKDIIQPNTKFKEKIIDKTMFMQKANNTEILKVINSLKENKANGYDNILAKTLKIIKDYIAQPLVHIFNLIIETEKFPEQLKTAVVVPIYKAGDKHDCQSYRPISLLSDVSKIFEKLLKIRIANFLEKYKILSNKQYGFREGLNTGHAIDQLISFL